MAKDVRGLEIKEGQLVAVAQSLNSAGSCEIVIKTVTQIKADKVYLDNSKQPLRHANRIAIVEGA